MRSGFGLILGRIAVVLAGLAVAGIVGKLVLLVLAVVLPGAMTGFLAAGWAKLLGIVGPAVGGLAALTLVAIGVWVVAGRRH